MALVPYPEVDNLDPEVRRHIEHFSGEHGRPTLLRMMLAWVPEASAGMDDLYHPVMENGLLSRRLKELLFVSASHARECQYCTGGHSRFLVDEFGYDVETVMQLRAGEDVDGLDPSERALVIFVRQAAAAPQTTTADDIERLRKHGWTDAQIVEALAMACHAGYTTTLAQAMHLEWDIDGPEFEGYF